MMRELIKPETKHCDLEKESTTRLSIGLINIDLPVALRHKQTQMEMQRAAQTQRQFSERNVLEEETK